MTILEPHSDLIALPVSIDLSITDEWNYVAERLPFHKFEILGLFKEEEITFYVEDYIKESIDLPEYRYGGEMHPRETYWDYETNSYWLPDADESFKSLLLSNKVDIEDKRLLIVKTL